MEWHRYTVNLVLKTLKAFSTLKKVMIQRTGLDCAILRSDSRIINHTTEVGEPADLQNGLAVRCGVDGRSLSISGVKISWPRTKPYHTNIQKAGRNGIFIVMQKKNIIRC